MGADHARARGTHARWSGAPPEHLLRRRRRLASTTSDAFSNMIPSGSPSASRRMMPPAGSGDAGVDARGGERGGACPQRVEVERAQCDVSARCDPLEHVGMRPGAPATLVPARAEDPAGRRDARPPRRRPARVRHRGCQRRKRSIDSAAIAVSTRWMCASVNARQRDLARSELDRRFVRAPAAASTSDARPAAATRPSRSRPPRPSRTRRRRRTSRSDR